MTRWIAAAFCVAAIVTAIIWVAASQNRVGPYWARTTYDTLVERMTGAKPETHCQPLARALTQAEQAQGYGVYVDQARELCVPMSAPRLMHGLFVDEFEFQLFLKDRLPEPTTTIAKPFTWMEFDPQAARKPKGAQPQIYAIEFMGSESTARGMYGHLGSAENLVIVSQILKIRPVSTAISDGFLEDEGEPSSTNPLDSANSDSRR